MSDERDETRSFSPFDDATWADDEPGPGHGRSDDRSRRSSRTPGSRPQPQSAGPDDAGPDDATRPQSRADDPTVIDGPAGRPPPDATSVLPPVADSPAWSGRAEVRVPQPAQTTYQEEVDWPAGPPPQPRDRWWMPILIGIIVLVLLAALGWGIYLIFQNAAKSDHSPAPAVTTSAPPLPTAAPTSATTQTTEPSTGPATTTPAETKSPTAPADEAVAIPALRGLTVADAKSALNDVGITRTRVIYLPSNGQEGTVIDSDPKEGQEVPPDTTVTLIIAAPSTGATTTPATVPATPAGG